ncbi:MAG: histidine kinase [Ferruginibacter sp.]
MVDENPERARRAITELSNILRSSMKAEKAETVSLQKELDIVKDYLALEHMRFEERLNVEMDIDKNTLNQQVPPMMLQTLVENSIKHGISKLVDGGVVRITADFWLFCTWFYRRRFCFSIIIVGWFFSSMLISCCIGVGCCRRFCRRKFFSRNWMDKTGFTTGFTGGNGLPFSGLRTGLLLTGCRR